MTKKVQLLLLPGDGIGPEVMAEVEKVLAVLSTSALDLTLHRDDIGGAAYERYGVPLADETLARAREVDAVIMGAVGGPKWDDVPRDKRPEAGLLKLRKELDLFANLRPATCRPALAAASSLKPELVAGLDILIVRELTAGVYFGTPRGIETLPDGTRRGLDSQLYHDHEIARTVQIACELARTRDHRVMSVEKANVMETGVLWRQVANEVASDFSDIRMEHMYADNCAMQLVRAPKQFDVIVTDNLFGDILSDCAAMLTGSLGMLPSASLGPVDAQGKRAAMYEPVHGSAPDIAGQGKANPLATLLSLGMCLRYSLARGDLADALERAVDAVLDQGLRTADLAQADGTSQVSTQQMGDAVCAALRQQLSR